MASDSKEEVVFEGREVGELVNEDLWDGFGVGTLAGDAVLSFFRK